MRDRTAGVGLLLAICLVALGPRVVAAQAPQLTRVGSIPGPAELIRVQGSHAYVAAGKTLTIFDITDPAAPKRVGSYSFPEKIWGFRTLGTTVYVAADFFGLGILDVSNPATPVLRGSLKTPGQAKNVALAGTRVLVADHMSGIDLIDISNPVKPSRLGSFFVDGYARDVVMAGTLAYAVDAPTGLYVLDPSKTDPFEPVATVQSANAPSFIEISEGSGSSPTTLACLVGAGMLQIYDLSNPTAPVKLGTFKTPGRPQRATLKGSIAYVADGAEGLQIVDLSAPATPRLVASHKLSGPVRDVAVTDTLVLTVVADREGQGEVVILRRTS